MCFVSLQVALEFPMYFNVMSRCGIGKNWRTHPHGCQEETLDILNHSNSKES